MEQQDESHVSVLQEEMLAADVLRRLPPRSLAASRCVVCKSWHAVVDGRRLLRPELLPRTLGGIFVDFNMLARPEFFSASSGGATAVSRDLGYMPRPKGPVVDHCNGLLLRSRDVVNPATRQWAPLPPRPPPRMSSAEAFFADPYLVFDPSISPHYEVFLMPVVARWARLGTAMATSEWPPSPCETHVFSSRTGRWEERSFVREGEPAGTVAAMAKAFTMQKRYSVHWRGAFYVHCQNDFICRVSMADGKYRVIKPPAENEADDHHEPYLGRSEKGVYYAILDRGFRLRVWFLDESSTTGQMEWVLRHQSDLERVLATQDDSYQRDDYGAGWCFKDINQHYAEYPEDDDDEEATKLHFPLRFLRRGWRRLVKASDTSNEPHVLHLSNLDLLMHNIRASTFCIYPKPSTDVGGFDAGAVHAFESGLPSFLNHSFLFAGRIATNPSSGIPEVHCGNQGAELLVGWDRPQPSSRWRAWGRPCCRMGWMVDGRARIAGGDPERRAASVKEVMRMPLPGSQRPYYSSNISGVPLMLLQAHGMLQDILVMDGLPVLDLRHAQIRSHAPYHHRAQHSENKGSCSTNRHPQWRKKVGLLRFSIVGQ
nr:unnamed protein product [Digitaria exilis]